MRTYSLIKKDFKIEPYLENVKNLKDRISMTKFRLSNHNLMIEKGRHLNLVINERKCPFCLSIEDEKHFLLDCNVYSPLRNELIITVEKSLNIANLRGRGNEALFKYLPALIWSWTVIITVSVILTGYTGSSRPTGSLRP